VKCYGGNDGSVHLNVAGGSDDYSYEWIGSCPTMVRNAKDQIQLTQGDYTVTVADNKYGCQVTKTIVIEAPEKVLRITDVKIEDIKCYSENKGSIEVSVVGGTPNADGGYNYFWTGANAQFDSNSNKAENLFAGLYNLVVTDINGCIAQATDLEITQPAEPLTITVKNVIHNIINGGAKGEITVSVSGGYGNYHYEWTDLSDTTVIATDKTHISGLEMGDYKVKVVDENGCETISDRIHISQPDEPLVAYIESIDVVPCQGDANGMIDVDVVGGTIPYTITCYNDNGYIVG
jgi:hypothetical protein